MRQIVAVGSPRDLEIEPRGRYLYVADMNAVSGGVRGFAIASDGTLSELPGSPYRFDASRPWHVEISSNGRRVYVLDLDNGITSFATDEFGERPCSVRPRSASSPTCSS